MDKIRTFFAKLAAADKRPFLKKLGGVLTVLFVLLLSTVYFVENAEMDFQSRSESLATGSYAAVVHGFPADKDGFGLGYLNTVEEYEYEHSGESKTVNVSNTLDKDYSDGWVYTQYKSQFGLQGKIYCLAADILYPTVGYEALYYLFRIAASGLFAAVVWLILAALKTRYGFLFSAVFGAVTFLSPWIVNFSGNLYWVPFTWFVPMLLGLVWLEHEKLRPFVYPLFFIAIFVKCLCGYEYISTIMMGGIMFLLVEWVMYKEKRPELLRGVVWIGVASVAGFLAACAVHGSILGEGNIPRGLMMIKTELVDKRTYGNAADFDPSLTRSLNASVFDVLKLYFWKRGIHFLSGKMMLLLTVVTSALLFVQRRYLRMKNDFELCLFVVTLLSTLSWFVLAKAHSFVHPHINFVLFYFGWVQVCVYVLCRTALRLTKYDLKLTKLGEDA